MDNLTKTISTLHSEIQSIVQECDLPRLNLELDALNHAYVERIEELKRELNKAKTKVRHQRVALSGFNSSFVNITRERDELKRERDATIQEAKIQACELDTQKGVVQSVRDLLDIRVHDFNLIPEIRIKLDSIYLEQQAKGIESVIQTGDYVSNNWLRGRANELITQAKG